MSNKYLIVEGDILNGLSFVGPFDTMQEAEAYAQDGLKDGWLIARLCTPDAINSTGASKAPVGSIGREN